MDKQRQEQLKKGAVYGLLFGSGVNPRISPMLEPQKARERFGNKKFGEYFDGDIYDEPYKLYDQYTQSKIVADILAEHHEITPEIFKEYLLKLHAEYDVFKGDVYGPSTQKAITAIQSGEDIYKMGKSGITCGAAMRGLPVGIYFSEDEPKLIENTVNSCIISHNTDVAIEATLISNLTLAYLLNGSDKWGAVEKAIARTEDLHGQYGFSTDEPSIPHKIKSIVEKIRSNPDLDIEKYIGEEVGVSWFSRDTIPGAFANYLASDTPEESSLLSMRCGGDNNTVPEISCSFMGAEHGIEIFDTNVISKIEKANDISFEEFANLIIA